MKFIIWMKVGFRFLKQRCFILFKTFLKKTIEIRAQEIEKKWKEIKIHKEFKFKDQINFGTDIKLENEIGKGSFGTVYKGIYNTQKVAVKIMDKERIPKVEYIYTEIGLMSTFNHRFIQFFI